MTPTRAWMTTPADQQVRTLCTVNPNLLVPHFLMHSYLYYEMDRPIISDATFDWMVDQLATKWAEVGHWHKELIDPSLLKTGYYLAYPERVKWAANQMVRDLAPSPPRRRRPRR